MYRQVKRHLHSRFDWYEFRQGLVFRQVLGREKRGEKAIIAI